ncbi:MAG: GDP-L-fucose synthase [Hydrocarboniphaga sp.]|uniref:GDP-L-fucose synthase n=1 Tax=Hydrocarboniphaga sp. TaxID=2033016 RepID=UPI00262A1441|nr:GDP-L-fucose synthase [Hydrocarboniphaga sp.]MDB5969333.1 GDP-L-fucose synthase [Hydrocarboniphaga sp.]
MDSAAKIYVAGHRGLAGGAIVRSLQKQGFTNLLLRTHAEVELTSQAAVDAFFAAEKPDYVFLAAAKVGGIHANNIYPAEFIRDNLAIQTNVIHSAWKHGTRKLAFLGSSCIYPKLAPQPMPESCLLTGPLEATNEWYAIAKIAGIKMCQAYRKQYGFDAISLMPTNLYGPGDNFNLENSHVLPALIRKFHEARQRGDSDVVMWGTGTPRREFLHVDDLGDAAVFLMQHYSGEDFLNVGVGDDVTIRELAELVKQVVGFEGRIVQDLTKPDGTPRKLMDVARLSALGWKAKIGLHEGLAETYRWFLDQAGALRV